MTQITVELRLRSSRMALARRAAAVWLFVRAQHADFDEAACFRRIARFYAHHMTIECRDVAVQ